MRNFILPLSLTVFLVISNTLFSQSISLISYGVENDKIFVRWKTTDTNKNFSIYRSQVLISNQTLLTNYAVKIGTFKGTTLIYKNDYLYYYDTNPFIGTNYYLIFENDGTNDIIVLSEEQNYSKFFTFFIPLPKVNVTFEDLGTVIVSWDKIEGIDGYLVYKVKTNFDGKLENLSPITSLPKEENILIDNLPKNKEFTYIVIPFIKGLTNFYYSKEKNFIFISSSSETQIPEVKPQELKVQDIKSQELKSQELKAQEAKPQELKPQEVKALEVKSTQLESLSNTNVQKEQPKIQVRNQETERAMVSQVTNISYSQVLTLDEVDIKNKMKEIISSKFSKGRYQSAKKDFEELLNEIEGSGYEKLEGEIMIYISRCDYALGNKDKAIKTLIKAKKILPEEADFWLTRFLINSR